MILFKKEDLLGHESKFILSTQHQNTWVYYTNQYEHLLRQLNRAALELKYQLNIKSYPYLFLLRHLCELRLKTLLKEKKVPVPKEHCFDILFTSLNDVAPELKAAISHINVDDDGSCYRYLYDKKGNLNALYGKKKEVLPFFLEQVTLPLDSPYNLTLGINPPFRNLLSWEFTFHFKEISYQGQLRSTYDAMTSYVLRNIISEKLNINIVYLPLLFLIRHSVELALKGALVGLIHTQDEEERKRINRLINSEHKLSVLFKKYLKILPQDLSALSSELCIRYQDFLQQTEHLNTSLHKLDTNSRYFRYPYDPSTQHRLILHKDILLNIILDFLNVDAFLSFNVEVLKEHNIVPYSNEEVIRMIGLD